MECTLSFLPIYIVHLLNLFAQKYIMKLSYKDNVIHEYYNESMNFEMIINSLDMNTHTHTLTHS